MSSKNVMLSAVLAMVLVAPVRAAEPEHSGRVASHTANAATESVDCFYEENSGRPECRK